jgi:hypothetical protein
LLRTLDDLDLDGARGAHPARDPAAHHQRLAAARSCRTSRR